MEHRHWSLYALLAINGLVMLFHALVVTQVIPYGIVWAGKLGSVGEMYKFEAVSLTVNAFFLLLLLRKGGYALRRIPVRWANGLLWAFAALFALNTVGNAFAATWFERYVFGALTLVTTVLLVLLLRSRKA